MKTIKELKKNLKEVVSAFKNAEKGNLNDLENIKSDLIDEIRALDYGVCDYCSVVLPIERGGNFFYCEKRRAWLCWGCKTKLNKMFVKFLKGGIKKNE